MSAPVDYEEFLEILEDDGELPVAAALAVEDHDGLVLYEGVHFGRYDVTADLAKVTENLNLDLDSGQVQAAVATFGCMMAHRSHRGRRR